MARRSGTVASTAEAVARSEPPRYNVAFVEHVEVTWRGVTIFGVRRLDLVQGRWRWFNVDRLVVTYDTDSCIFLLLHDGRHEFSGMAEDAADASRQVVEFLGGTGPHRGYGLANGHGVVS